jgi:ribosomal subunit interface protein
VDIVVKGRHLEVSDRFRALVEEKLAKVERLEPWLQRVDVEVSKEPNPRQSDRAYRVELTCRSRGPVIRAEAAADDKLAALDVAWARLEARLRRAADRRSDWKKHDKGLATASSLAGNPDEEAALAASNGHRPSDDDTDLDADVAARWSVADEGPMVVRRKTHEAAPMSLDRALYEMELVGHDFFLFVDETTSCPSVVYRRRAYDYGVIQLEVSASG